MRISDWSSDVCSSDLSLVNHALAILGLRLHGRRVDLLDILECVAAGRQRDRCGLRLLGSVAILDFLRRHRFSPGANKIDRSPVAVRYNTFTDCTKRASSALESSSGPQPMSTTSSQICAPSTRPMPTTDSALNAWLHATVRIPTPVSSRSEEHTSE